MIWERGIYDVCLGLYLLYQLTLRPRWYVEPMPTWAQAAAQRANDMMASMSFPNLFRHGCYSADVCPFGQVLGVLFFVYLSVLALVDWASPEAATSRSYVVQRKVIGVLGLLLTLMNPVVFMRLALPLVAELVLLAAGAHEAPGLYTTCGVVLVASAATHNAHVDLDNSAAMRMKKDAIWLGALSLVGGDRLEPTFRQFLQARLKENVAEYDRGLGIGAYSEVTSKHRLTTLARAHEAYVQGVEEGGDERALRLQVAHEIYYGMLCNPGQ